MPFGVNLDAKLAESAATPPQPPTPAPERTGVELGNASQQSLGTPPNTQPTPAELVELDKLEKFKWNNREWTPKELADGVLRQEDYTVKTKQVAENRKYAENFAADLDHVIENPDLFDELKRLYPAAYVKVAERALARLNNRKEEPTPSTVATPQGALDETSIHKMVKGVLDKELNPLKEWKSQTEKQSHEAKVEARGRELDSLFEKHGKKYPDADSEVVNARALAAIEQGSELSEAVLEKIFKGHHEEVGKRFADRYKKQTDEQLRVNKAAQDAGPGGGTPGQAPPAQAGTLREARDRMLADIDTAKRA